MTAPKFDPIRFVHTPARAVSQAMTEFERRQNALHRLGWGVPVVDDYLIPMMDGDLISLVARPGHSKTSSMIHLVREASRAIHKLNEQGTGFDRIAVYVTWETLVEEFIGLVTAHASGQTLEQIARGEADLEAIRDAAVASIGDKIYIIGRSRMLAGTYVPITLETVDYILRDLREQGKNPVIVALDYLQRIPSSIGRVDSRVAIVGDNVGRAKNLGENHFCPVVMGVQASRDVDEQSGLKFASLNMAQWASVIEQDSDKYLSLTRPILYMEQGSEIEYKVDGRETTVEVTQNLLAIKVQKQRWGKVGKTFFLHFDPAHLRLGSLELDFEDQGF